MNKYLMVLTISLLVTGCDNAKEITDKAMMQVYSNGEIQSPAIAIYPGWQIDDNGKMGVVNGYSECPRSSFGNNSESGCVIIYPKDESVSVFITTSEHTKKENWTVERKGVFPNDALYLKRPDNTYVIPWKKPQLIKP
jgi:hypothetical protein